jgi:galactonate dehydratase
MKITKIETFKYWIEWCNWLFVKVSTDEGLFGWGEGSLHGPIESVEIAVRELGNQLIGLDPSGVEAHWQRMYRSWRWRGGPTLSTAMAAIDIALWDIEGKRLGVPLYRLFGGPYRTSIKGYASHWLPKVKTEEEAFEGARDAVRRGFQAFKWNPIDPATFRVDEAHSISHAAKLMAAAREGAGPSVEIFIECSEQLSPRSALQLARAFEPFRPGWFEEPIPFENIGVMNQLQKELPVPIATGERLLSRWQYLELLQGGGCKVIQPDVMHAAGLTEVRKIAAIADTFYIPVAPHNPGGPICNLASMHLAASIPNFYILEQMEYERELRDRICTTPVKYSNGYFELPTGPGLGTDLNLDVLQEYSFQTQLSSGRTDTFWW